MLLENPGSLRTVNHRYKSVLTTKDSIPVFYEVLPYRVAIISLRMADNKPVIIANSLHPQNIIESYMTEGKKRILLGSDPKGRVSFIGSDRDVLIPEIDSIAA